MEQQSSQYTLSLKLLVLVGVMGLMLWAGGHWSSTAPSAHSPATAMAKAGTVSTYDNMPLYFEANHGQTDARVKFLSRGNGYTLFMTPTQMVFVFAGKQELKRAEFTGSPQRGTGGDRGNPPVEPEPATPNPARRARSSSHTLRMQLLNANPNPKITGLEKRPGKSNYLIGNDRGKWRTDVTHYARVKYQDVYPGIDMVFYGKAQRLEYDFVLAPGADPHDIRLGFRGVAGEKPIEIDAAGNLILHTETGDVIQHAPIIYQEIDGARRLVSGRFTLLENAINSLNPAESGGMNPPRHSPGPASEGAQQAYGFKLAAYNKRHPLIIDPGLEYSTFLGGSDEDLSWILTVDAAGNVYVAGETYSTDFPTTPGALDTNFTGGGDIFVAKLDPTGSTLLYSTFLGGIDNPLGAEGADAIAIDKSGNVYFTGWTSANDFPTTAGAFDTTFNGGGPEYYIDAFVAKLDATGSILLYSTFLGGSLDDWGNSLVVDSSGNAFIAGVTYSTNFPTTPGVFDRSHNGGLGDAFVTKLDPTGSSLLYSTFLGGSEFEEGGSVAVDGSGNAYVAGYTESSDFPVTSGAFDTSFNGGDYEAYVSKLNATASQLIYSTFLGGSGDDLINEDGGNGMALDALGKVYVTGITGSNDFPTTPGAFDTGYNGLNDAFVSVLNPQGSNLDYSTYLGGGGDDGGIGLVRDATGNIYVVGKSTSASFPTTSGALDTGFNGMQDAFVAKLSPTVSSLLYSTFLGGSGTDIGLGIAVDTAGGTYVTGETDSPNFPTQNAYQGALNGTRDAFIAKLTIATGHH